MAKKYKEIVGDFKQGTQIVINEEVGQITEGIYDGYKAHVGENDSNVHYIKIDGELCQFWGSKGLDPKLTQVEVGQEVKITYKGRVKSSIPGRKAFYSYIVEIVEYDSEEEDVKPKKTTSTKKTTPVKTANTEEGEDEDIDF